MSNALVEAFDAILIVGENHCLGFLHDRRARLRTRAEGRRMVEVSYQPAQSAAVPPHTRWVRISHAILSVSVLTLAFSGFVILMAHPRCTGARSGTISRPRSSNSPSAVTTNTLAGRSRRRFSRTPRVRSARTGRPDIFNQNGWGRSLHFLAGWSLVLPGLVYLVAGIFGGHFRSHLWPKARELAPALVWRDIVDHLNLRIPSATGRPQYTFAAEISVLAWLSSSPLH